MDEKNQAFSIISSDVAVALSSESTVLPLPKSTYSNVYIQARVLPFGERARKGWMLTSDLLGDGYKSLVGGHVNLGHNFEDLYGYVTDTAIDGDVVLANMALSRKKLEKNSIDPERIPKDYKVSLEWTYNGNESFATKGSEKLPLIEALDAGWVVTRETMPGVEEIIAEDQNVTILPVGTALHDIALVDLKISSPAFPSAAIIAAVATDLTDESTLLHTNSLEAFISRIADALRNKFNSGGDINNTPWVRSTFSNAVVYERNGRLYKAPITFENDAVFIGEETKVAEQFVGIAAKGRLVLKDALPRSRTMTMLELVELVAENSVPLPKNSGRKAPLKGYPKDRAKYADPTNYAHPIDTADHARAAIVHFHNSIGPYSRAELTYMAKRIARACKAFNVDVPPASDVGRYAGLNKAIAEGGENLMDEDKITMTKDEFQAAIEVARNEGRDAALEECKAADSDFRASIIAGYEEKILPSKLEAAKKEEREQIETINSALTQLDSIHPLAQEEKEAHLQALGKGEFDLRYELAARELRKLKGEFGTPTPTKTVTAAATVDTRGSGLSTVDPTPTEPDESTDGNEEIEQVF